MFCNKMKFQSKVKAKEFLFFNALIFYCADYFLGSSLFDYILPRTFFVLLKGIFFVLLGMKFLIFEKFTAKKLTLTAVIVFCSCIVMITGNYSSLFTFVFLSLSGADIDFDKIIRILLINMICWTLVIILACKAGILQDYTFIHRIGETWRLAHSLGFKYYGWLGYNLMAVSMMWIYLRQGIKMIESIILICLNYAFYLIHTTNLAFILTIFFIVLCYCTETLKIVSFKSRFWKWGATLLPSVLGGGTFLLVLLFRNGKFTITLPFLNTINSRLKYSVQALEQYGIHLFGTHVIQVGNTEKYYGNASTGFYIDSGYIYSIIAYGLVFTLLLLVLYTVLLRYLYNENKRILFIWFTLIIGACCVNNFLIDFISNPILFLIPNAIFYGKEKNSLKIHLKKHHKNKVNIPYKARSGIERNW